MIMRSQVPHPEYIQKRKPFRRVIRVVSHQVTGGYSCLSNVLPGHIAFFQPREDGIKLIELFGVIIVAPAIGRGHNTFDPILGVSMVGPICPKEYLKRAP